MDVMFFCEGCVRAPLKPGLVEGGVGVYLHGVAEDEAGFDIPDSNRDLNDLADGIYPVGLNDVPGYTLFMWRASNDTHMLRGLITKDTDIEGTAFARKRYSERPNFL